jgi:hypothetical protein
MDKLTKFSLLLINSIGVFCLLTIPHILEMMFDSGFVYPMPVILLCSILSVIGGVFLTNWEERKLNKS